MKQPPVVRPPKPSYLQPPVQNAGSRWGFMLESRAVMFGMLFGVTGFLGIPFLWMSPKFSHREKMVWSVVVTIYTLVLIGIAAWICWWSYSQITQILK